LGLSFTYETKDLIKMCVYRASRYFVCLKHLFFVLQTDNKNLVKLNTFIRN